MTLEFKLTGLASELQNQWELKKIGKKGDIERAVLFAEDLALQTFTFREFGIPSIELRFVGGVNVSEMSDSEAKIIALLFDYRGIAISSLASPAGKVDIQSDMDADYQTFRRSIELARILNSQASLPEMNVRVFSYGNRGKLPFQQYGDRVVEQLRRRTDYALSQGVTLLHENEQGTYGATPERCQELVERVGAPNLRLILDPGNLVQEQIRTGQPIDVVAGCRLLLPYIAVVHLKDWNLQTNNPMMPGQGDAHIEDVLRMLCTGREGSIYISMEPHMGENGRWEGVCPKPIYKQAVDATRDILEKIKRGRE